VRPFLLLSIRTEVVAAADEEAAFRRFLGIDGDDGDGLVRRVLGPERVEVDLDDWSGVVLGGGAFTCSDPEEGKTPEQRRAEDDLSRLYDDVLAADFPFLGVCYGVGTLGRHLGATVDRAHPEPVGPVSVTMTAAGRDDPVTGGCPPAFAAYGGHKEALADLPPGAELLATSQACPVQAFRVGEHVLATQFHPELDLVGLRTRIDAYAHHGYFDPADAARLRAEAAAVEVTAPMEILRRFADRHARE